MKINNFRGDVSDISAKTATLTPGSSCNSSLTYAGPTLGGFLICYRRVQVALQGKAMWVDVLVDCSITVIHSRNGPPGTQRTAIPESFPGKMDALHVLLSDAVQMRCTYMAKLRSLMSDRQMCLLLIIQVRPNHQYMRSPKLRKFSLGCFRGSYQYCFRIVSSINLFLELSNEISARILFHADGYNTFYQSPHAGRFYFAEPKVSVCYNMEHVKEQHQGEAERQSIQRERQNP